MKLSDELKHCLDGSGCGNCEHHEADTKFICRGLLEKAYERIKWYEELEEQGLLLRLPCKVGDTVYTLNPLTSGKTIIAETTADAFFCALCVLEDRFGKTVFLTREQAEAELKKNKEAEE